MPHPSAFCHPLLLNAFIQDLNQVGPVLFLFVSEFAFKEIFNGWCDRRLFDVKVHAVETFADKFPLQVSPGGEIDEM